MNLSTRLALGYGVLLTLLVGLIAFQLSTAHANSEAGQNLSRVTSRLLLSATDQRHWIDQMEESATKYRISGDTGYIAKFEEFAGRFDEALDRLSSFSLTDEERDRLEALASTWSALRQGDLQLRRFSSVSSGDGSSLIPDVLGDEDGYSRAALQARFDDLRRRTEDLVAASLGAMGSQVRAAHERTRRAELLAWIGAAIALLVSAAVWVRVVRSIRQGLIMLTDGTRRVASGDFQHRLDPDGQDEFAELSRHFNAMTERLAEIDELKQRFVSRISHDLKSPLASMQEANNLLLDELVGPLTEDQHRILGLSRENGRQLAERINSLLEISRLEAGTDRMNFETHDLPGRVQGVADRLSATFLKGNRGLELDLPSGDGTCVCDGERFDQLLENLLDNARRFAPEGTTVHVSLDVLDGQPDDVPEDRWQSLDPAPDAGGVVRLSVTDAGPGVPDGDKERVFGRFVQQNGWRSRDGRGSGLGLALCREVAELHGGAVWVEDAESGGARFTLLLPRRPAGAEEDRSARPARA